MSANGLGKQKIAAKEQILGCFCLFVGLGLGLGLRRKAQVWRWFYVGPVDHRSIDLDLNKAAANFWLIHLYPALGRLLLNLRLLAEALVAFWVLAQDCSVFPTTCESFRLRWETDPNTGPLALGFFDNQQLSTSRAASHTKSALLQCQTSRD